MSSGSNVSRVSRESQVPCRTGETGSDREGLRCKAPAGAVGVGIGVSDPFRGSAGSLGRSCEAPCRNAPVSWRRRSGGRTRRARALGSASPRSPPRNIGCPGSSSRSLGNGSLVVAAADFVYLDGSLLHSASQDQAFVIALTALLMAVLLIGLLHRQRQGPAGIGWESSLIVVLFLAGYGILYTLSTGSG